MSGTDNLRARASLVGEVAVELVPEFFRGGGPSASTPRVYGVYLTPERAREFAVELSALADHVEADTAERRRRASAVAAPL